MFNKTNSYCFAIGLFLFSFIVLHAQDQREADKLRAIYEADTVQGIEKFKLLEKLAFNERQDLELGLIYARELIELSEEKNNKTYQSYGHFHTGNLKRLQGNLQEAIDSYFTSAKLAKEAGSLELEGSAYSTVADIYSMADDHQNAAVYYLKAIEILRQTDGNISLASVIMNYGFDLYYNQKYDSALVHFEESGELFTLENYDVGKAYNIGNIGMVYAKQGRHDDAERNINEAITILKEYQDYYAISDYLLSMADIYVEKNDHNSALNYANNSLDFGKKLGLKEQIRDANLKLSELHEFLGNTDKSLMHYKDHIIYRDSLNNIQAVQERANLRTEFEVSQKQLQVEKLNQQKRNQLIILGFTAILLVTLFWYYKNISKEKAKSDNLLLNILPSEIATELKAKGEVEAVKCNDVTVLFTDFVAFSSIAEHIEPEILVKSIDRYFKKFDEITVKHGLEKIKTVGDSYMCASGLPSPNKDHAKNALNAAIEMNRMVTKDLLNEENLIRFEIRIGLHSGPVVAGIVGIKKWQYDIWGDTVNIASRMESNSKPGKINISETTFHKVKNDFSFEYRGELEVKNRGNLKMYFLKDS